MVFEKFHPQPFPSCKPFSLENPLVWLPSHWSTFKLLTASWISPCFWSSWYLAISTSFRADRRKDKMMATPKKPPKRAVMGRTNLLIFGVLQQKSFKHKVPQTYKLSKSKAKNHWKKTMKTQNLCTHWFPSNRSCLQKSSETAGQPSIGATFKAQSIPNSATFTCREWGFPYDRKPSQG